jgi:hypothetical protein
MIGIMGMMGMMGMTGLTVPTVSWMIGIMGMMGMMGMTGLMVPTVSWIIESTVPACISNILGCTCAIEIKCKSSSLYEITVNSLSITKDRIINIYINISKIYQFFIKNLINIFKIYKHYL